ncbi:MAG TPA: hypothetical protein VFE90_23440 [Myxococcales bacterium]|nr:hypothetical protein [Myxococcales bacterium]
MRALFVTLLAAACSTTPSIGLSAAPSPAPGDGVTPISVEAVVTAAATVRFQASAGTWEGGSSVVEVETDEAGRARASLTPPRQGYGAVEITASAAGSSATARVPLVASGGPASRLTFACARRNLGALVTGRLTDIHVLCTATAQDAAGRAIPNASIQTLAEAGALSWLQDAQGAQEFVYTVRPDDAPPAATAPVGANGRESAACPAGCEAHPFDPLECRGEPCWTEPGTGLVHNPRDGIATLVAAVPATGVDDIGEPFVDANDDGVREGTEPFLDYDGNGRYDGPSGKVQDHLLWKAFRIIWSGEAAVSAAGAPAAHDSFLVRAGPGSFTLALFDRNYNQLAADGPASSDGIAWSAACASGSIAFDEDDQRMEQGKPGVLFGGDEAISGPQNRATWTQAVDYTNGVHYTPGGEGGDSCTISARPHRVYDPGAPGLDPQGIDPDPLLSTTLVFP